MRTRRENEKKREGVGEREKSKFDVVHSTVESNHLSDPLHEFCHSSLLPGTVDWNALFKTPTVPHTDTHRYGYA